MERFNREKLEMFLGVVRKYMQLRGNLSQKDLAELTNVSVSTLSRFLNQKTKDIDSQLIALIVAKLDMPLHEMIDFVERDSEERFKAMVKFYKELPSADKSDKKEGTTEDEIAGTLHQGTAQKTFQSSVNIGGKPVPVAFSGEDGGKTETTIRDKLQSLSPRQKAYLSDFLDMDIEGRDLIVDLGNSIFRYFRQKGVEF